AEHDEQKLLYKILRSLFRFVNADRGVILLMQADGTLKEAATYRRDRSTREITLSSTVLTKVIRDKTAVLTGDAKNDFGQINTNKSIVSNNIESAIVVPLLHENEIYGVVWLDSELVAQFGQRDLELVNAVAAQAAMFVANVMLQKKIQREKLTRE